MQESRHTHEPYAVQMTAPSPRPQRQQSDGTSTCTCDLLLLRALVSRLRKQRTERRGDTEAQQTARAAAQQQRPQERTTATKKRRAECRHHDRDPRRLGGSAARALHCETRLVSADDLQARGSSIGANFARQGHEMPLSLQGK